MIAVAQLLVAMGYRLLLVKTMSLVKTVPSSNPAILRQTQTVVIVEVQITIRLVVAVEAFVQALLEMDVVIVKLLFVTTMEYRIMVKQG